MAPAKKLRYLLLSFFLLIAAFIGINLAIQLRSNPYIFEATAEVPVAYTAIVPGALVSPQGIPSNYLQDRLDVALELYTSHKVQRFLLSGDHGRSDYDEVNSMKKYLLAHGVDSTNIFLDHAGFDTYNTMVRARDIFKVKDAIIISQQFHLPRAVFIARSKGITTYGVVADRHAYGSMKYMKFRESIANIKACMEVLVNRNPVYAGDSIPINGDSRLSYD